MMYTKWIIAVICALLFIESNAQLPDYYFNIREVFPTSLNFGEGENGDLRFRALKVKRGENESLILELIDFTNESDKRVVKTFYVTYETFELAYFNEIEFKRWISAQKLELDIDGQCFVLNLEKQVSDSILATKCD